jgi:hypothetical protein
VLLSLIYVEGIFKESSPPERSALAGDDPSSLAAVVFSFPFSFPLSLTFSPWFRFICLIKLLVSQRNRPHSGQFFPTILNYVALSVVVYLGIVLVKVSKVVVYINKNLLKHYLSLDLTPINYRYRIN